MRVLLTSDVRRTTKKLHAKEKEVVDEIIEQLAKTPLLGDLKVGDLAGVRVVKFSIHQQQLLLAYVYNESTQTITLVSLAPHENFYRNLKNILKQ